MVLDAAYVAGTIASMMMNGACCVYQMNREDELREELRREIRREWYKQRKRDVRDQQLTTEEHRKDFEARYQRLMARRDSGSYTHTHKFFARTSPPRKDPPSVAAQLMISRSSSILEDEEEEEEEDGTIDTSLLLVTDIGSDGTMEDVSLVS